MHRPLGRDERDYMMSDKLYSKLKIIALLWLPALGTFYAALSSIWGFPAGEEVLATIIALDTLLGVIIKFSQESYNASEARFDGDMDILDVEGGPKQFTLNLNGDPEDLERRQEVHFKVRSPWQQRSRNA